MEEYCERKLLDHYLEPIAIKNDLSLQETRLLLYFAQLQGMTSRKELVDFTNMNRGALSVNMQKLVAKGFIKIDEKRVAVSVIEADGELSPKRTKTERKLEITFQDTAVANSFLKEIPSVLDDYEQARYDGFTEDEQMQYAYLANKIKENTQKVIMSGVCYYSDRT